MNNGINHLLTGAGFLPSTVSQRFWWLLSPILQPPRPYGSRLSLRQHLATRLGLRSQEGLWLPWAAWAMPRMPRSTGSTGGGYCWLLDAVGSINCYEKLWWFRCLYEGLHQRRFDWEITGGFGFWLAGLMGVYFEFCFWREELCVREPCQVWATSLTCR